MKKKKTGGREKSWCGCLGSGGKQQSCQTFCVVVVVLIVFAVRIIVTTRILIELDSIALSAVPNNDGLKRKPVLL